MRAALGEGVPPLPVRLERVGERVSVAIGEGAGGATVTLMRFADRATHAIARGENGGRTITYRHPVHAIEPLGAWTGGPATFAAVAGEGGVAVLVQRGLGPILGAASLGAASLRAASAG